MDILFSIGLIIFSIYCFFLVGIQSPAPTPTELGAAFWPRIILILMIILLFSNLITNLKQKKIEKINIFDFFKSKLFIGMLLIVFMTISMSYIGFITSCFIFLIAYGALLGEKNIIKLIIFSFIITAILYIVFQGLLDIRLERGIGIFRNIALSLETIILKIKRGI
ncbi:MAG: tripartite tricarboxylate transporter TctB family protein [Fusobacterium perfoetens]|uniref:tripartite tricarboxylate transporter TctB family protein n=1 Tax=Fusobacterium perfoetens TaxID=852 RepID=UPI0023F0FF74|nr:tripartite tricarboxylate transporter TctB family protein [Fusobacterium perfoetens]MCI6152636.1 tripartite tricarboxylate transporter TctB family protein [Fusobacterium perfoetens]MDY3237643.1 tripartite tricarboxylate transporter TctB family protein [Fusobacterium perfoetens]